MYKTSPTCSFTMPQYPPSGLPRCEKCQEINPTPIFDTPTLPFLFPSPSQFAPPPGCKVSVLHPTEAEAQHQALSEPAQMPTGAFFISVIRLQFQYCLHPPKPPHTTTTTTLKRICDHKQHNSNVEQPRSNSGVGLHL